MFFEPNANRAKKTIPIPLNTRTHKPPRPAVVVKKLLSQSPREANFVVGHKVGLEVRGNTCWCVGREVETVGPGAQAWVGGEGEEEEEAVEVKVENRRGREMPRSRIVEVENCRGRESSRSGPRSRMVEVEVGNCRGRGQELSRSKSRSRNVENGRELRRWR